ncbi:phosphoribosylpyrophosphate synthetase [Aureibacter tunicatorum]|uniref:Phosphoribosylpyrophosphate synthetase n=1 Tax=Aureibacter tunicatorum TaxID=866807 RepID=A0AAE4BSP7_9BACT|nr:phosphoribosylpyrophosphate synthetase [Aureibacter tunicatorum]MDR6239080.1 hypothetical protein [Aureibacter tunicatorum]BDD04994.1 hypothetical protein AUTU_24770 [Aureibacter tunicatorum]
MKSYDTLSEAINDMTSRGYEHDFQIENDYIKSSKGIKLGPKEFEIIEIHRFEGMSSTDDNEILFVIESNDGTKGYIIDAYGVYGDNISPELLTKFKEKY